MAAGAAEGQPHKTGEAVAAFLRRRIVRGELPVGTKLPTEEELTERFGIARTTLREALRVLESQGLIHIKRGRGGGGTVTLAGSAPAITAAGTHTISAPLALANSTTVTTTNAGDTLTVSGVISGPGMNLTKNGAGTLALNAANTYSGTTTVANGTLAIGAAGSLANTTLT
ncbi:MAG: GntR family transcriptional regulator, partial [Actinomycetota bacterium]